MRVRVTSVMAALALTPLMAIAATFGNVVQLHGQISDLALDETRNHVFAANFTAYRVEVLSTVTGVPLTSIPVSAPPSAVAVSPDGHYLVIGLYQSPVPGLVGGFQPLTGGLVIFDLTTGAAVRNIPLGNPVVSVAFGSDGKALVAVSVSQQTEPFAPNIFALDPSTGVMQTIAMAPIYSRTLPQNPTKSEGDLPAPNAPTQIVESATAVSADRKSIFILGAASQDDTASSNQSIIIHYDVPTQTLYWTGFVSTPNMGPRSMATDATGTFFMSGWTLDKFMQNPTCLASTPGAKVLPGPCEWAQVASQNGAFNLGSHAWDVKRNLIYSQVPAPKEGHVLNIMDTDNLTVRERIQMSEDISGRSLMSSDGNTMYSISASGITIFPIGQLPNIPQIATAQEDLLFADTGNGCTASLWTQTLNINSLGTAQADFTLSLPKGTTGITLSQTSGTTPAQVQVTIDPLAFQLNKGTTTIPLSITSNAAINLPPDVRLLINMHGATQVGRILNVPGKIVDILTDQARNRLYLLRQDKNLVLVYDAKTLTQIGTMRTGNTPTQMTLTLDNNYMVVGNDNSMIANVLDLNTLTATDPILFPFGHYPRSIGITANKWFSYNRNAGLPVPVKGNKPVGVVDQIDFASRTAFTPETLDGAANPAVYSNTFSTFDGMIAPSGDGQYLMLAVNDGTLVGYDASENAWVAARKDFQNLQGSFGVLNNQLWNAGPNLVNGSLVPAGNPFPTTDGIASGVTQFLGIGARTSSTLDTDPGVLQLIDTNGLSEFDQTLLVEAPVTYTSLKTGQIGQIGQTIPSLTRTLAAAPDQSALFALTASGLTIIPGNFYIPPARPAVTSVVSSADGSANLAAGGLISISGTNLSGASQASGFPLATSLGSACYTINGEMLSLYYASPSLVNAQIPYDVTGTASIVVRGPAGISDPFTFNVQPAAPSVFQNTSISPDQPLPYVTRQANGLLVTPSNPAHTGDILQIFLAGMGQTDPPATAGVAPSGSPVQNVVIRPTVTIGGAAAAIVSAHLVPGVAGVYEVDAQVATQTPLGLSVPLTITQAGVSQSTQVRVVK
jgi:uncharacterized protein (TIGR03437 family)